jgi:hypothetical protein
MEIYDGVAIARDFTGIAASRAWNKVLRTRVGLIFDESNKDV